MEVYQDVYKKFISRCNFINFYRGFYIADFYKNLLKLLAGGQGFIYLLNFSDYIIDLLSLNNITVKTTSKKCSEKIISVSDKVLLLRLISGKVKKSKVKAIIIGSTCNIDDDSKIICIMKLLSQEPISFHFITDDCFLFSKNLSCVLSTLPYAKTDLNVRFFPRFDVEVQNFFLRKFKSKNILIKNIFVEYDENSLNETLSNILLQLMRIIIEEISYLSVKKQKKDLVQKYIQNLVRFDLLYEKTAINETLFSQLFANKLPKAKALYEDLLAVKILLYQVENFAHPPLYSYFHQVQARSFKNNENDNLSIFTYLDSETNGLICNFDALLKNSLYTIQERSSKIVTEEDEELFNNFIGYMERFPNVDKYHEILETWSLEINIDHFELKYKKFFELINVLEGIRVSSKKENVLIIVSSDFVKEIIKDVLKCWFVLGRNFKSFFEKYFFKFLVRRIEFMKRMRILKDDNIDISSKKYIEVLLLQFTCFKLSLYLDSINQNIFESILATYNEEDEYLPSEVEITEEMFNQFEAFKEEEIIAPHFLELLALNQKSRDEPLVIVKKLKEKKFSKLILFNESFFVGRLVESIASISSVLKDVTVYNIKQLRSFSNQVSLSSQEIEYNMMYKNIVAYPFYNSEELIKKAENESEKGSFKITVLKDKDIIVDTREMGARAPYYLYDNGFKVITGQLEIGDYIVSNSICIERKSISTGDLHESLRSSRLTNQIVKMDKYYHNIIILCEFENYADIEKCMNQGLFKVKNMYEKFLDLKKISSKIIYFWSLNPKMTSDIVVKLKEKFQEDVFDVERCLNINKTKSKTRAKAKAKEQKKGVKEKSKSQSDIAKFFMNLKKKNVKSGAGEEKVEEEEDTSLLSEEGSERREKESVKCSNEKRMAINVEKFIRSIDGVTNNNYNLVIENFKNLREFILSPKEKLYDIFGRINGSKIAQYFTHNYNKNEL